MKKFFLKDKFYLPLILLLYILCSFFTLSDLAPYNYYDNRYSLYPWQYSFLTIFLCLIFILYIFMIFIFNKNLFIPFLLFMLILTAGSYILGFAIFDEIIISVAAISIIVNFFYKKKEIKLNFNFESILFIFLVFSAIVYSIIGLNYTIKSVRYLFLYFSVLIIFLYSISNLSPKINKIFLINYIYYSVVAYFFIQIVLWVIKFYFFQEYFQTKLFGYMFWGNMQPVNSRSATSYTGIAGVIGTFISIYILRYSQDYIRPTILIFLLFIVMCLEDSRALLLLLTLLTVALLLTKFNSTKFKFAIVTISLCSLLHFLVFGNNNMRPLYEHTKALTKIEKGEKDYNYENSILVVPKSPDGLRQMYALSGIMYVKNKKLDSIIGCGLYGYWICSDEIFLLAEEYEIHFKQPQGNFQTKYIRPPSLAAIIIEFGLGFLSLSIFLLFYCYYKRIKFISNSFFNFKNLEMSIFYFYCPVVIILWMFFGNVEDVAYIYLLTMPNLVFYNLFKA